MRYKYRAYETETIQLQPRTSRVHVRLIKLCARPLDVLLHEQQLLHPRQLLRIFRTRKCATEILYRQTGLLPAA